MADDSKVKKILKNEDTRKTQDNVRRQNGKEQDGGRNEENGKDWETKEHDDGRNEALRLPQSTLLELQSVKS